MHFLGANLGLIILQPSLASLQRAPKSNDIAKPRVASIATLFVHQPARGGAPTKMIPVTAQALPFPYTSAQILNMS